MSVEINGIGTILGLQEKGIPSAESVGFLQSGTGAVARTLQDKGRDVVSVKDFGAVGDGVTDDTAAIQAALYYVYNTFGGGVVHGDGRYLIDSANLNIPRYVAFVGPYERMATSTKNWIALPGTLIVNPTYSIVLDADSQLKGWCIIRKGLPANVTDGEAGFSGTAVQCLNTDTYCGFNAVIGFQRGFYNPGGTNRPRQVFEYNIIDCVNGIDVAASFDIGRIQNNHCFPFSSPTLGDTHLRSGVGIALRDVNDWTKLSNNYVYGYETGYLLENVNSVTMFQDSYDAPLLSEVTGPRTSVGLKITGTSNETIVVGFQCGGADKAIQVNSTTPTRNHTFVSPVLWANKTSNIEVLSGSVQIIGGIIRKQDTSGVGTGDPIGIVASGATSLVRYSNTRFMFLTTDVLATSGASIVAGVDDGVFGNRSDANQYLYIRGESGGVGRLYLDNVDNIGAAYFDWLPSNSIRAVLGTTEVWRGTATGLGVGTALPRAKFHSLGNTILGLATTATASTTLDDNVGPQVQLWLDEANNKLMFRVIYPGAPDDTGRAVKSGEVALI